jgi:hypothetical protein
MEPAEFSDDVLRNPVREYASFGSEVAAEVRREAFGEDIGQQGWRTAAEQAEIAEFAGIGNASYVLDVCCGSGGPSLALVQRTGCRLVGIDREEGGICKRAGFLIGRTSPLLIVLGVAL